MLSPTFCFSFSTPCKHWCNNAFHYTEDRRWVHLVAPLHLNNRSTAVFKKLITFLAVAEVSRNTLRCNIGSSDQQQISAEMKKSCLWWVQHVNDLCVFIGHGAGPALLQDSGVGTTLWQRLATADVNNQERGGLTLVQHFRVCALFQQNVSLSFSYPSLHFTLGVVSSLFLSYLFQMCVLILFLICLLVRWNRGPSVWGSLLSKEFFVMLHCLRLSPGNHANMAVSGLLQ